jgi:prepilin-type N-terminal cleavage/methylation domain-containing protein
MYTALRKSLNKENDKGFTLIELLVVIIIIGILAAIAIPIFLSQRKKGFEASEKSDARSIATQMETFYTDSQVYPTSLSWDATTRKVDFGADYVVLSPNNTAEVFLSNVTGGGFCVVISNTNTDKKAVYDSEAGGLQAGASACGDHYDGDSILEAAA